MKNFLHDGRKNSKKNKKIKIKIKFNKIKFQQKIWTKARRRESGNTEKEI